MPHTANGRHTPSTLKRDNTVQVRLLTKPSDGLTAVCRLKPSEINIRGL